jgi:hypothetical protein
MFIQMNKSMITIIKNCREIQNKKKKKKCCLKKLAKINKIHQFSQKMMKKIVLKIKEIPNWKNRK